MNEKTTGTELVVQKGESFIDAFKKNLTVKNALASYLGNERNVIKFVSSMSMCFASNPKLSKCTPASLSRVFLNCAEWGLYPSHVTGECYVIPYKDEATFQLGYQGMIALAYRAGVKSIDAQVVYEKDLFEYEYGLNQSLKHVPKKFADDRGEAIGAYAVATLENGIQKFEILSKSDIFKHRAKSQSWSSSQKYSPWNPDNDPQLIMWRKTVLKQLFKMLPKTPTMQQAVNEDIKGDIIDMKSEAVNGNPAAMDIQAFVQEAHEFLYDSYNKEEATKVIEDALKEVTGSDSFDGITTEQLAAVKKLIFTGEAPSSDDDNRPDMELK